MYTDELKDVRTSLKMYGRVERCREDKYARDARNGNFGLDATYTMKLMRLFIIVLFSVITSRV